MSGRIILDTNIIISLFNGDIEIYEYIKQVDEIFIPSIAIGELYYGAHKSLNSLQNIKKINEFAKGNISYKFINLPGSVRYFVSA